MKRKEYDSKTWRQSKESFRADIKLNNEFQIKKIVLEKYKGISHGELAKQTGLNRKNLRPYMKRLIEAHVIRRGPGLRGKYFLGKNFFKDSLLSASLIGNTFSSELLAQPNLILSDLDGQRHYTDFRTLLPYFQKEEYGLCRNLFEFVNKIGAYITYILIQAMSEENKYLEDSNYSDSDRDRITLDWVNNSITPIIRDFLVELKDCVHYELESLVGPENERFRQLVEFGWNTPQFQLKKEVIDEILFAYSKLYPMMYNELEKLRKNLPYQIQDYENHIKYLNMQHKCQDNCEHRYENNLPRLIESDGNKFWTDYGTSLYHCKKCHHTMSK